MSSTRVMAGLENLEGGQTNTLRIGRMLRRRPEPLYLTVCNQCDAESSATHTRLRNGAARCLAAGCGKPTKSSDRYDRLTEREAAAERENARIAEDREASARRMEHESQGWERPTKYKPLPTPYEPRSDRERMEIRERRAAEEAEEAERLRPIREAEDAAEREQVQRLRDEEDRKVRQNAYWQNVVLTEADPRLFVSPEMTTASMPTNQVDAFNAKQVNQFIAETAEFADFKTPANADAIIAYFQRNGVHIFDVPTLRGAFRRLRDLGILTKRPAPAPEKPAPQPRYVNLSPAQPTKPADPKAEVVAGWEIDGSAPRKWTQRQLDRLSANDYRRALHLYREHIQMPGRLV